METRPARKVNAQTKKLLKTIIKTCDKERQIDKLLYRLDSVEERVSLYTGYPKSYIFSLSDDEEKKENAKYKISLEEQQVIHETMKDIYINMGYPQIEDVYKAVKAKLPRSFNVQQCRCILGLLGYSYKKTNEGFNLLLEDPKNRFERFHYLTKIRNLKKMDKLIYYLDERVIDIDCTFKKLGDYAMNNTAALDKAMIFFHVISINSYVNGLFCQNVNKEDYEKWIINIVLPVLKPSSVIVIENNPLHGSNEQMTISKYHKKDDMIKWLRENNIPCSDNMNKAELFELIEKCPKTAHQCIIDRIFKADGHEVVRIPTFLRELSLINLVWKELHGTIRSKEAKLFKDLLEVKQYISSKFQFINSYQLKDLQKSIENIEIQILDTDDIIEKTLDKNYNIDHSNTTCNENEYEVLEDSD